MAICTTHTLSLSLSGGNGKVRRRPATAIQWLSLALSFSYSISFSRPCICWFLVLFLFGGFKPPNSYLVWDGARWWHRRLMPTGWCVFSLCLSWNWTNRILRAGGSVPKIGHNQTEPVSPLSELVGIWYHNLKIFQRFSFLLKFLSGLLIQVCIPVSQLFDVQLSYWS